MASDTFDADAAARFIVDAHRTRARYVNLAGALVPPSIDHAYAAQEALLPYWVPERGPIGGLKIATTTKVMQALMGIDHPCGGMIFSREIHASGYQLPLSRHLHVVVECELAVRVGRTLGPKSTPWTRAEVQAEILEVMPAFELIEDRHAVYRETRATSMIADNCWNAGIVIGRGRAVRSGENLDGVIATLATASGEKIGKTDDPMGALAWVVNLAIARDRPLAAGQVVITGSAIPTLPIALGETFQLSLGDIGQVAMTAVA